MVVTTNGNTEMDTIPDKGNENKAVNYNVEIADDVMVGRDGERPIHTKRYLIRLTFVGGKDQFQAIQGKRSRGLKLFMWN